MGYENGSFGISETITQEIVNPLGKIELQHELINELFVTSRLGYTYVDIYNKSFVPFQFYGAGHNQTNANPDLTPITVINKDNARQRDKKKNGKKKKTEPTYVTKSE